MTTCIGVLKGKISLKGGQRQARSLVGVRWTATGTLSLFSPMPHLNWHPLPHHHHHLLMEKIRIGSLWLTERTTCYVCLRDLRFRSGVPDIFPTCRIVRREKVQDGLSIFIWYPDSRYETTRRWPFRRLLGICACLQQTLNNIGACLILLNLGSEM